MLPSQYESLCPMLSVTDVSPVWWGLFSRSGVSLVWNLTVYSCAGIQWSFLLTLWYQTYWFTEASEVFPDFCVVVACGCFVLNSLKLQMWTVVLTLPFFGHQHLSSSKTENLKSLNLSLKVFRASDCGFVRAGRSVV